MSGLEGWWYKCNAMWSHWIWLNVLDGVFTLHLLSNHPKQILIPGVNKTKCRKLTEIQKQRQMGRATHGMKMRRRIKLEHQFCTCNPPRFTNLLRNTRTAWHVSVATASRHQSSGYYLCQSQRCDRQMLSMTDIRQSMGFLCPYSNQALIFSALTQPAECCQHMPWFSPLHFLML